MDLSLLTGLTVAQEGLEPIIERAERPPCAERPFCNLMLDLTDSERSAELISLIVEPASRVLLVIALAFVASWLAHRAINRAVDRMKSVESAARISRFRSRTRLSRLTGPYVPSPRRIQRSDAIGAVARSGTNALILLIAILMILPVFGINLAPLIAGAGIIGLALGFGAQGLVRDLIAGVSMLIEDQFGVGDIIDVGEARGTVEGIGLRTTRIRDVTGTLWHVPNGEIHRVGNMSQEWARTLLDIEVAYATDLDRAMTVIGQVATQMAAEEQFSPDFLDEPEVWGVENMGDNAITLRLVIKTSPGRQWVIARELRRRLKYAFDEAGIEIPFPQRTVWLQGSISGPDAEA